ncbi:MAG: SRPBCC domain-containing protein [Candidatus Hydrogenedentes bacterium]|nr:SRPBCC domain-containing protein [Candidatus Hydrogenedentota bacterium]
MSANKTVRVQVTHSFTTTPERVFDAWLDPHWIGQWMFGPNVREEEVLHLQTDPRVDGAFSFLVRRGETTIDHIGAYRELDRPHRLVFTWGIAGESVDESVVTILIEPTKEGCALSLTHVMDVKWAEYASRTQAGWTTMLNALANALL